MSHKMSYRTKPLHIQHQSRERTADRDTSDIAKLPLVWKPYDCHCEMSSVMTMLTLCQDFERPVWNFQLPLNSVAPALAGQR